MSSLGPAQPPETGGNDGGGGGGGGEQPTSPPALPPENDDIIPPLVPVLPTLPPLLSPPVSTVPTAAPPPLPLVVVGGATPPPTSPILSPPPSTLSPPSPPQPQPQPQQDPQPPVKQPPLPPVTKSNPPQKNPTPPPISPPVRTNPPPQPKRTKPSPATAASPPPRDPPRPVSRRPVPKGASQPSPSQVRPKPTPAIIPSPPPVALPVPQAPSGGAWLPFSSEPPSPLPEFPGPPAGVTSSPASPLLAKPSEGIPSAFAPRDSAADHQNIEADNAANSSGRSSGSSGFIVGLSAVGILLLVLGAFAVILFCYCRRRQRKYDNYGSGSKNGASSFTGFEDKASLSQYTKQGSYPSTNQFPANVANPHGPNLATSGTTMVNRSPTSAIGASFSNGMFTYEELAGATDGFSDRNLLGQGGFGYVHKGVLPNGKEVAVKQLKMGGHQGEREFRAEVETISQVHHKHLVSLVGYCISGDERLLVYEFVPNNTLDFHLHGKGQPVMDWHTRLKTAIGSAKGLAYLHEDCSPTIIHRDIKAANILLDYNFEAKVSDFGLAKIFSNTGSSVTHITTRVVGTFGYLAPEYASSGKVTDKSDVYSYGVMLLELITGRPPIGNFESGTTGSLVNWARPLLTQAIGDGNFETLADPRMQKNYDADQMASMVACAAACVRLSAWRRPRMSQVVHALEGNLPLSELDDGTRPGHSAMHFPYESLDFDARNYLENLKRMAMTSNVNGYTSSRYSENTSEYGLNPSVSSTDTS